MQSDVKITAVTSDRDQGPFVFAPKQGGGENFFTILAQGGETITSVSFSATDGWNEFQQPRVSGISGVAPVPEASTWGMMVLGFAGLGYAAVRRNARDRLGAALG